jgi:hypothetical protein
LARQIFFSHSGKDREIVDAILKSFDGTGVRPLLMEDVQYDVQLNEEANWRWIRRQIQKSEALFVILSKGLIAREHTQNWVAYEIGVAAGCEPPKPVFVITGEKVEFPVPYLNHFFPYSIANRPEGLRQVPEAVWNRNVDGLMKKYIENPHLTDKAGRVRCKTCRTEFYFHGSSRCFRCPCCNAQIEVRLTFVESLGRTP